MRTFRRPLAVVTTLMSALCLLTSPASACPSGSAAQSVFGINMSLYDHGDQVMDDAATRRLFRSWGIPVVRVPMRRNLDDPTLTKALSAVREIGAVPVVILNGPGELAGDDAILARDLHDLELVHEVFGDRPAYLEYGNEDDLGHGVTAEQYAASWNAVIGRLKAAAPQSYMFVGPAAYQSNPAYIGTFVTNAEPRPDFVSWHEYVCQAADTSTCTSHLAHWRTHAENTNAAERSAIGTTIPFLITEWNVDPADSAADQALYGDPGFIQPWTMAALTELRSLTSLGLAGALIYTASNHGNFALVTPGPTPTPQGRTFGAEAVRAHQLTASNQTMTGSSVN